MVIYLCIVFTLQMLSYKDMVYIYMYSGFNKLEIMKA